MGDKDLMSFLNGMLGGIAYLKELHIHCLDKLKVLPTKLSNLNALGELNITGCNNLETLTKQVFHGLDSLKRLIICKTVTMSSSNYQQTFKTSLPLKILLLKATQKWKMLLMLCSPSIIMFI